MEGMTGKLRQHLANAMRDAWDRISGMHRHRWILEVLFGISFILQEYYSHWPNVQTKHMAGTFGRILLVALSSTLFLSWSGILKLSRSEFVVPGGTPEPGSKERLRLKRTRCWLLGASLLIFSYPFSVWLQDIRWYMMLLFWAIIVWVVAWLAEKPDLTSATRWILPGFFVISFSLQMAYSRWPYGQPGLMVVTFAGILLLALTSTLFLSSSGILKFSLSEFGVLEDNPKSGNKELRLKRWHCWLLGASLLISFYPFSNPFSVWLQDIGWIMMLVFLAIIVMLVPRLVNDPDLVSATMLVVLLVFGWIWELSGRPGLVVLPVDIPTNPSNEFTSDGVTNLLLTSIRNWPPQDTGAAPHAPHSAELLKALRPESYALSPPAWYTSGYGSGFQFFQTVDVSHTVGTAEVGGVQLAPIYRILRYFRHRELLEAQVLVGANEAKGTEEQATTSGRPPGKTEGGEETGSLTLALRLSNRPALCFSEGLPDTLAGMIENGNYGSLTEQIDQLIKEVERDLENPSSNRLSEQNPCESPGVWSVVKHLIWSPATLEEQRVSDATVYNLRGNERLTSLVERAVLAGMQNMSPERVARYYVDRQRSDSGLKYLKQALEDALYHMSQDPRDILAVRRVAGILMAIGDIKANSLENLGELPSFDAKDDEKTAYYSAPLKAFKTGRKYYELAKSLDEKCPLTRIKYGVFLLTKAQEFEYRFKPSQWGIPPDDVVAKKYPYAAEENYKPDEVDAENYLATAKESYETAVQELDQATPLDTPFWSRFRFWDWGCRAGDNCERYWPELTRLYGAEHVGQMLGFLGAIRTYATAKELQYNLRDKKRIVDEGEASTGFLQRPEFESQTEQVKNMVTLAQWYREVKKDGKCPENGSVETIKGVDEKKDGKYPEKLSVETIKGVDEKLARAPSSSLYSSRILNEELLGVYQACPADGQEATEREKPPTTASQRARSQEQSKKGASSFLDQKVQEHSVMVRYLLSWQFYYEKDYAAAKDIVESLADSADSLGLDPDNPGELRAILEYRLGAFKLEQSCDDDQSLSPERRNNVRLDALASFVMSTPAFGAPAGDTRARTADELETDFMAKSVIARILASSPDASQYDCPAKCLSALLPKHLPPLEKIMAELTGTPEEPSSQSSQSSQSEPYSGYRHSNLGLIQLHNREVDAAIANFEQATRLDPQNPQYHYLLGFAIQEKGQMGRGRSEWEYGQALDPARWVHIVNPLPGCGPVARGTK
jgi:tetratricopeptide (TPR) repeat protein